MSESIKRLLYPAIPPDLLRQGRNLAELLRSEDPEIKAQGVALLDAASLDLGLALLMACGWSGDAFHGGPGAWHFRKVLGLMGHRDDGPSVHVSVAVFDVSAWLITVTDRPARSLLAQAAQAEIMALGLNKGGTPHVY